MSNKKRLMEFNRNNILLAAKQLFQEKGIAQTTVDDIARKADYSKSTLYVYFKNKEEIYHYIILENFQLMKMALAAALREYPGFPEGYYAVCDAQARFYTDNPLYFDSILGEIALPEDDAEPVFMQIYKMGEEINELMEEYIKRWSEEQKLVLRLPPLQATFTLWAGISGIITMANKKEIYINRAMGITKDEFMRDGFELLLQSIILV